MNNIRTAVIGTSWWADGAHLPGLRALAPEVDVVALCGRNPERLAALAAKFHIPQTYTDYPQLLAEVKPEVVVILTPNRDHTWMTLAALEAGAHVIGEKPLAATAAEAHQLWQRAEALGKRHLTFFTYRAVAAARYVRQLIDEGYLGDVLHVQASYQHGSWLDPARPAGWKTSDVDAASGVLGDLGAHLIDLCHWWVGPLARVAGAQRTFITERRDPAGVPQTVRTDDATAFVGEFANGALLTAQLSRVAAGRHNTQQITLSGTGGTLVYDYDQPLAHVGRVWGTQAGGGALQPMPIPAELTANLDGPDSFLTLYRNLTANFFASLRASGPTPAPSFAEGWAAQTVIEAVTQAAQRGAWVSVEAG